MPAHVLIIELLEEMISPVFYIDSESCERDF